MKDPKVGKVAMGDLVLTPLQNKFVTAFLGECEFDAIESCRVAGYKSSSNPYSAAKHVLSSEAVRRAIHSRMHKSTAWLNEGIIVDRLFKEGMTAKSDSARINAFVWLGKHLGMWNDKLAEEESSITYNVVNYSVPQEAMLKEIAAKPDVEASRDLVALPEGVVIADYGDTKGDISGS